MTLEALLQNYLTSERVNDVECEGCQKLNGNVKTKSTFVKTSSIGKVYGFTWFIVTHLTPRTGDIIQLSLWICCQRFEDCRIVNRFVLMFLFVATWLLVHTHTAHHVAKQWSTHENTNSNTLPTVPLNGAVCLHKSRVKTATAEKDDVWLTWWENYGPSLWRQPMVSY